MQKGNQTNMASLDFGNTPLISAKNCDNGLKSFVSPNSKPLFGGNIITLNLDGDGGAGIAYYQPVKIALDSHVACLSPKIPLTRHQQLFVAMCIKKQRDLFGHGYSINSSRLSAFKIMLPINSDGNPHWEIIDSYMRGIESEQLLSYLHHIKNISV